MGKKNGKKMLEDVFGSAVSANECTGLLQKISLDPEEIEKFREEFNKK